MIVKGGSTDVITYFQMRLTAGGDATGLTITDFDLSYTRSGAATAAKVDAVAHAAASDAHTDGEGIEVDPTDCPGLYRFDFADAAFAAGVREVILTVKHASCFTESLRVEIVGYDPVDGVRLGLTALPNAAAEASGGLPTLSAAQASNGTINANVHRWLTGTPNALQSGRVDSYIGAVASGVIAAASFAANALDAVWSTATRLLTAGTNIVLAKGTGVTGFNDLSAAQVNAEADQALADYDGPTKAELDAAVAPLALEATAQEVLTDTGTTLPATLTTIASYIDTEITAIINAIAALNNLSAAQVNAEVVDALSTDTYAEPGQGNPPATASLATKVNYLYKLARNKKTQDATTFSLFNDAGDTVDQKSAVSDDNTTLTRGELVTGP